MCTVDDVLLLLFYNVTSNYDGISSKNRLMFYEICDKFFGKKTSEIEHD